MAQSLADFVHAVSGDSHLAVEENLGDGFVRLKTAEAERRQPKHDIRAVEDIVVEMLRNSRDAHARNIYLACSREGRNKTLVFIDDGDGVPLGLRERIFEPRVTSKLETMVMDKWGVHGRGMALYSIKCNTSSAQVVSGDSGLGSSIRVVIDLEQLQEKADQSTLPKLVREDDGSLTVGRGPHNVLRNIVEFSLECKDRLNVYYGSPTDIVARLYEDGRKKLSDDQLLFCDDVEDLPVSLRPGACLDAAELVRVSSSIALPISERTAHRIIAGQIEPAAAPLQCITPTARKEKPVDLYRDNRGLKIAREDLQAFSDAAERSFRALAERYYLDLKGTPRITVGKDSITVRFNIDKG